jgi:rRNA-processing protein FCF1
MRLRHGVTVASAINALVERISDSQAARLHDGSPPEAKRQLYLNWVDTTQRHLRTIFLDTELEDSLLGRGYWHICDASRTADPPDQRGACLSGRPPRGITGDPGGRLGEVLTRLRALTWLASRPGRICVPDTNALLHYTRLDQLPWSERMNTALVRLVIPLAVVDELDNKKYARREEFQQRARELLTLIDRHVTDSPDGYSQVREGVTVEVLADEPGHLRMSSNDQEILDRCEFLNQVTESPVTVITGDSGMRITAQTRGINIFNLSTADLLPRHTQQQAGPGAR